MIIVKTQYGNETSLCRFVEQYIFIGIFQFMLLIVLYSLAWVGATSFILFIKYSRVIGV